MGLATARFDLTPKARNAGSRASRYDSTKPHPALDKFRVTDIVDQSSGSVETLSAFIEWAIKYDTDQRQHDNEDTKATKYLLILSGHGSGVTEDFFLRDETSMDSLTIAELQQALHGARKRSHKKIDILGLDACYMAMGEVAYQIRNEVSIVIGAEGLEPEFGWPYGRS